MKFESENPTLVKILGACVAAVMIVGSTFIVGNPVAEHSLFGVATFILGAIGIQVGGKPDAS